MRKNISILACALAAAALAASAYAAGPAGVGARAGAGASAGAGVNVGAGPGVVHGSGSANVNSNAGGELRGLDRAQDRMSDQGLEHWKALDSKGKRKGPKDGGAGASTSTRSGTEGSATTR